MSDLFFQNYLIFWVLTCLILIFVCIKKFKDISFFTRQYFYFLFQPWKIVTFLGAAATLIFISPYMADPTWDYTNMSIMATLTYVSAPWSIGVLYRTITKKSTYIELFLAVGLLLFSASWSYDAYILLRDGVYPGAWKENIVASSILYFLAGLLWNIEWSSKNGLSFSFLQKNWLTIQKFNLKKMFPIIAVLGLLVLFLLFYGTFGY